MVQKESGLATYFMKIKNLSKDFFSPVKVNDDYWEKEAIIKQGRDSGHTFFVTLGFFCHFAPAIR